jgi:hypothetical protein
VNDTQTTEPRTMAGLDVDSSFLLAQPNSFKGNTVVASAYLPAHPTELPAHLVVYYTHPENGAPWAAEMIDPAAKLFGVARLIYDDDEQETQRRTLAEDLTYAQAIQQFAHKLAVATGATEHWGIRSADIARDAMPVADEAAADETLRRWDGASPGAVKVSRLATDWA